MKFLVWMRKKITTKVRLPSPPPLHGNFRKFYFFQLTSSLRVVVKCLVELLQLEGLIALVLELVGPLERLLGGEHLFYPTHGYVLGEHRVRSSFSSAKHRSSNYQNILFSNSESSREEQERQKKSRLFEKIFFFVFFYKIHMNCFIK